MFKSQFKLVFSKLFYKSLILVVLFFLIRMDVNSMIYSRIQGEILNNDSGSPIADASVRLINYNPQFKGVMASKKIRTDKLGKFVFNDIVPGYYLIKAEKEGFVSSLPDYQLDILMGIELQNLIKAFPVITIDKEGSIKHLKIALKTGHTIKGKIAGITKKDLLGKLMIHVILYRKTDEAEKIFNYEDEFEIRNLQVNADGLYCFSGLEPRNDYQLKFEPEGFPRQYFNGIDILTKDTAIIDCIYDNNDKTGIKGKVKINGKVPKRFSISLDRRAGGDEFPYYYYGYQNVPSNNPEGEFTVFMVAPGKYYVHVFAFDENYQGHKKDSIIEIKKDETTIINFNL